MSFKRILLPVNDQDDISLVAELAFALADAHKAEVQGIFPQDADRGNYWIDNFGLNENEIEDAERIKKVKGAEAARRAKKKFSGYARKHKNINTSLIATFGDIGISLLDYAFCSDVIVLGNTTHKGSSYWRTLADDLLVQSTRPVIVSPSRPVSKEIGDRVVIAWKRGPEAARAVAAAMPLIENAKQVQIASVGESEDWQAVDTLKEYISLHAKNVETVVLPTKGENPGSVLVNKTAEQPGSILVMGAFSHARWRERTFGGVTEYILRNTDVPVLMMH